MPLTDRDMADLERSIEQSWEIGQRLGYDPFPIHYEVLPATILYEIAGYGMPGRFSHWSFGKQYARQKIFYDYGLSKIFELIINTNPCRAFLLDTNDLTTNKLIAAHCIGHSDFFKNNAYFGRTSRQMDETMAMHAERIRSYEYEHGPLPVEQLVDAVLAIDMHVDPDVSRDDLSTQAAYHEHRPRTEYDDLFLDDETPRARLTVARKRTPEKPVPDLLLFIAEHSTVLDDWQRDTIMMLRNEALYFKPQMRTKTINEGWASIAHTRIMRELDLTSDEHIHFARMHSSIVQAGSGSFNPYYIGYTLLEDIERRFGTEKMFEVRSTESDVSLIRNYLTEELVYDLDLFTFERFGNDLVVTDKSWEAVRDRMAEIMTNYRVPRISVIDGDYNGNMELFLEHHWDGMPLDIPYAEQTLVHIHKLWGRKVWLRTQQTNGDISILTYHNGSHTRYNSDEGPTFNGPATMT